jgi:hypothetical protein
MRRTRAETANRLLESNQDNASIQPFDVLLGRGKSYDRHSGNCRYLGR